ncbi:MAG: ABC transporter ATP-binding protein, partial [Candidatus Bathyarchaeia archaeon]
PDVLLLDEPLSNLDAKLRLEMRGEIKKIQRQYGITSIYVTHEQEEALSMADRLAVMNLGRIEQVGTPREIYNNPANSFIAGFIGEANFFSGTVVGEDPKMGLVLVETDFGEKAAVSARSQAFERDEKVLCSVRPEHVALLNDPAEAALNVFKATIERLSYYGAMEHYILKAREGREVKAAVFTAGEHRRKEGDEVYFTFRPEDVRVFSAEGGAVPC